MKSNGHIAIDYWENIPIQSGIYSMRQKDNSIHLGSSDLGVENVYV